MPPAATKRQRAHPFRQQQPGFAIYHAVEEFLWAFMIVATALVVIANVDRDLAGLRGSVASRDMISPEPISVVIAALQRRESYREHAAFAARRGLRRRDRSHRGRRWFAAIERQPKSSASPRKIRGCVCCDRKITAKRARCNAASPQCATASLSFSTPIRIASATLLRDLVEPFADAEIGAVSGHAKVGNLRSFIARCQALEYTSVSISIGALTPLELHHRRAGCDQRDPQIGDR